MKKLLQSGSVVVFAAMALVGSAGSTTGETRAAACRNPVLPLHDQICAIPDLQRSALRLVARLHAARDEVSAARRNELAREMEAWRQETSQTCAPSEYDKHRRYCLDRALGRQLTRLREIWTNRLFVTGDLRIENDRDLTRVCAPMNAKIDRQQAGTLESYVSIQPEHPVTASARGKDFCIEGLPHGRTFDISLRSGLTGEKGRYVSAKPFQQKATIGNRPASVRFPARGRVLSRLDASGLPVETVNISRLKVGVYRVADRKLAVGLRSGAVSLPMSYTQLGRVLSGIADHVWQGTLDTESGKNRTGRKALPIRDTIGDLVPGMYLAVAAPDDASGKVEDSYWVAAQWFNVSDLGLTLYRGADDLSVQVRSLHNSTALKNIRIKLKSSGGDDLWEGRTDLRGWASVPAGYMRGTGEDTPRNIFAYGPDGDFVAMNVVSGEIDMRARGSRGRVQPGSLDAFLATERGIYRPGETIHLTALLRDSLSNAVRDLPLLLTVHRADGVQVYQKTVQPAGAGSYHKRLKLPENASTGTWRLDLRTRKEAAPIGRVDVQVEDFVPPQIEVAVAATLKRDGNAPIALSGDVQADYLYGAAGAGLKGEMRVSLRRARSVGKGLTGFHFGSVLEPEPERRRFPVVKFQTTDKGAARPDVLLGSVPDTPHPLELIVRGTVFEKGGRPLSRTTIVPLETLPVRLGIRPGFEGEYLRHDTGTGFEIVALGTDGAPLARKLRAQVIRENVDHVWYRSGGYWNVRRFYSDDAIVAETTVETAPDRFGKIMLPGQEWGSYRVEVSDPQSGVLASHRFRVGWGGNDGGAERTPDRVTLSVAPGNYRPGDMVDVRITTPFAAQVELAVADQELLKTRTVDVPDGGTIVKVELPPEGVAGFYLLANAYAPADGIRSRIARRAVGLTWVPIDRAERSLQVDVDAPEEVEPGQDVLIDVAADAQAGEKVSFIVAAVDDAVLQLTGFGAPDPVRHYLGQRRLGLRLFDLHGQLIDSAGYAAGQVRSGGDALGRGANSAQLSNLPKKNQPVMVLHSGLLQLDADGFTTVPLTLPEFNGRLRLMVMAWSDRRVGKATGKMIVRRPVVAQLSMPRFLAPADQAALSLSVNNLSGPAGTYKATVSAEGPLQVDPGNPLLFDLEPGSAPVTFPLRLTALNPGQGRVTLTITGPAEFRIQQHWAMSVRTGNAFVTNRYSTMLQPGETLGMDASLANGLLPGTVKASVGVDLLPDLDLPNILAGLSRYPYGCAEQTVSKALAHLFVPSMNADLALLPAGTDSRAMVRGAIDRLSAMQMRDGQFGLWSARHAAVPWVSAYATDFLVSAKSSGVAVNENVLARALSFMRKFTRSADEGQETLSARAYAHYVLAQAGAADAGLLRRFHAVNFKFLPRGLARAHVAAALAMIGDRDTARAAFQQSWPRQSEGSGDGRVFGWHDYASPLRDRAAVVALMAESGIVAWTEIWRNAGQLSEDILQRRYLSTQEQGWIVRTANALMMRPTGTGIVQIGDARLELASSRPLYRTLPGLQLADNPPVLINRGKEAVRASVTVTGQSAGVQSALADGMHISREILDENGKPAKLSDVKQGQLLIVRLTGGLTANLRSRALVVDYLPAGLELENPATGGVGADAYSWLKNLTVPRYRQLRDDRFVAAFDLDNRKGAEKNRFSVAYVVRAVTPGRFSFGNAVVEDMYRPAIRGMADVAGLAIAP